MSSLCDRGVSERLGRISRDTGRSAWMCYLSKAQCPKQSNLTQNAGRMGNDTGVMMIR